MGIYPSFNALTDANPFSTPPIACKCYSESDKPNRKTNINHGNPWQTSTHDMPN